MNYSADKLKTGWILNFKFDFEGQVKVDRSAKH